MPWGWNQPIYYNYGDNVYYDDDMVYYGDQPVCSTDQYVEQAQAIAASIPPDVQPAAEDWLPLGVFAMVRKRSGWLPSPEGVSARPQDCPEPGEREVAGFIEPRLLAPGPGAVRALRGVRAPQRST
jgi:hypothetical protein